MSFSLAMPMTLIPQQERAGDVEDSTRWMLALARGETGAMDCLLNRWWKPLMSYFLRSTHSAADSEDLTLATLTQLYQAAPRYQPKGSFVAYLFTIARNVLISHLRRQSRERKHLLALEDLPLGQQPAAQSSQQSLQERQEQFEHALQSLPEVQRTALLLRVQQALSYEAIAEIIGLSVSATKTCLHRARQSVKTQLKEDHE
jgi:RNA polymerase sigma-70 factor (ECF subfamily)